MRVRVSDGCRLFVEVLGPKLVAEGNDFVPRPTMVMLHGGPGIVDHLTYRMPGAPFERLGQYAQLVLVDLRGMGRSDPSTADCWNLARWALDLHELFNVLGLERPVVFGESGGGFVALEIARRNPEDIGGLILENTSARWTIERMGAAFERRGGAEARDAAVRFWSDPASDDSGDWGRICLPLYAPPTGWVMDSVTPAVNLSPPDLVADVQRVPLNPALFVHFLKNEMTTFDHLGTLPDADVDTLVFGGVHDPICPVEDSDDLVARIPKERVTYIRSELAGHPVAGAEPELFVNEIGRFLRRLATVPQPR